MPVTPPIKIALIQILAKTFRELYDPLQLVVEHAYRDGYFCHEAAWRELSDEELRRLETGMRDWIIGPQPIRTGVRTREKVQELMILRHSQSKTANARRWPTNQVPVVFIGETHWDYLLEPVETDKSRLHNFRIEKFNKGFLIRFFPNQDSREKAIPLAADSQLFKIIEEIENWGDILQIATIEHVNTLILNREINHMTRVAEGLHEKKISQIADSIVHGFPQTRVISIAGPSSSGKTTFAKRLRIQLQVNGFKAVTLSMDDYFIDRANVPLKPDGSQDFETIDALDGEMLADRVKTLLRGDPIPRRIYDFKSGTGRDLEEQLRLGDWDFVVLEGIHGLNPKLGQAFGSIHLHRIYVSAITQLNIDAYNRISTSDNRVLRRIVRDHSYRGYSPAETLQRWPAVRAGEEKNIFPFQEEADSMFNSSLFFEFPILANHARPLLKNVPEHSPVKGEAERLDLILSLFEPMEDRLVSGISILREFIGGSEFEY